MSWDDAQSFIEKLSAKEKTLAYRLPSEAEWEYAARAGTSTTWFFGNDESKLAQYAWYEKNAGDKRTHAVATRHPNQWGLYDMLGNVVEWVDDCVHGNYEGAPTDGGAWMTGECSIHMARGMSHGSESSMVRPAYRYSKKSIDRYGFLGVRLAMMPPEAIEDYWYKRGADDKYMSSFPNGKYAADIKEKRRKAEEELRRAEDELRKHREQLARLGYEVGKSFRDCPDFPEMVVVPAGNFTMGSPEDETGREKNEGPQHRVTIAKPFAMGKYEVTVGEFRKFVAATAYRTDAEKNVGKKDGCDILDTTDGKVQHRAGTHWDNPGNPQTDRQPAVCLSWNDAKAYVEWLAKQTGKGYRLPSEAEWEYTARAGTAAARYWGNDPNQACRYANVADQSKGPGVFASGFGGVIPECNDGYFFAAPAGTYMPNAFGLYDMLGNVLEWVEDCGYAAYIGAPTDGSVRIAENCGMRVYRGGGWNNAPQFARAARRNWNEPANRSFNIGFRLARMLP